MRSRNYTVHHQYLNFNTTHHNLKNLIRGHGFFCLLCQYLLGTMNVKHTVKIKTFTFELSYWNTDRHCIWNLVGWSARGSQKFQLALTARVRHWIWKSVGWTTRGYKKFHLPRTGGSENPFLGNTDTVSGESIIILTFNVNKNLRTSHVFMKRSGHITEYV
jgi:hypothetical protein